jgi:hypothetical protein
VLSRLKTASLTWVTAGMLGVVPLVADGCGRANLSSPDVASGARTSPPGPTQNPSPTATAVSTASWKTYTSAKWGYTIKYPQDWIELPNYGAPDTEKYFSNQNVGAPSELDKAGIYFAISVNGRTGDQCLRRGLLNVTVDRQLQVTLDGVASTLNVLSKDGFAEIILNVQHGSYCYWFAFVFRSSQVRDATEPTASLMLGESFRFGKPSATPVSQS